MIFPVAGVTRIVKAARDRLPDRVAIGVLTRTFPPELVDEVIDEAGAREQRRRSLPARLTVYFVLAMWLWREHGYEEVLRQLLDGLAWSGSITKARTRLGPDPLRLLFTRAAGPTGSPEMAGCFWRGQRLTVIDGSTMDVADSKENRAAFDGHRVAETVLAQRVLGSFGPGMLVMADRQFLSWKLWRDAAATKADLLWRVSDSFTLPVIKRLPDGSYLSRLNPPRKKDGDPITVRVIEYTVTTRDEHGEQHSELFCLATTMLDPHTAPIEEIPALYHERWRGETLLDVVKTDVRGGADVLLRSQSPAGIRQEMWALFCLYQALAHLVGDAARRSVSRIQAGFPPSPAPAGT